MWIYSIAVYGFFSRSISVILILTCGIALSSSSAVCGFHFGHHLADGIQWNKIVHSITVLFISAFLSIQYANKDGMVIIDSVAIFYEEGEGGK